MRLLLLCFALGIIQTITLSHPSGIFDSIRLVVKDAKGAYQRGEIKQTLSVAIFETYFHLGLFKPLRLQKDDISRIVEAGEIGHGRNKTEFIAELQKTLKRSMGDKIIINRQMAIETMRESLDDSRGEYSKVYKSLAEVIEECMENLLQEQKKLLKDTISITCLGFPTCNRSVSNELEKCYKILDEKKIKVTSALNVQLKWMFQQELGQILG